MSNLSFENIDQWLFEFTEGNLSPAQESQLMDFISMHPELMEELKLWQHAKVSASKTPELNIQTLTKEKPFLIRPIPLVAFAVLSLLLTVAFFYSFPSQPQYTSVDIDTKIITIGNDELSYIETSLAHAVNKSKSNYIAENNTQIQQSAQQSTDAKTYSIGTTIDANATVNDQHLIAENIEIKAIEGTNENHFEDAADVNHAQQTMIKNDELDNIIAFINTKNISKTNTQLEEVAHKDIAEVSKTSQNRSFSNFTRKIKRMINQPTALRNTQSPYYHTPMMTGFKANPSLVGKESGNRIQATSRLQWIGKENEQILNSLSWDGYIYSLRGGLGVDVSYNAYNGNSLSNYAVEVVYSPKISIRNNLSFEPSISFKMGVMDIDPTSDLIGNRIEMYRNNSLAFFEGEERANGSQLWYKDLGLGFIINAKSFYFGFNADNLTRHNNNYYSNDIHKTYREEIHYTAVIGTEYRSLTRNFSVDGYGLFQNYGNLNELWVGANFRYKWMHIGAGANTNLDFGFSAGANIKRASLLYNIDYVDSQLMNRKGISHQLTLKILLKPNRYATKFYNL